MMENSQNKKRGPGLLIALGAATGGFLLALLLPLNPFGLRAGGDSADPSMHSEMEGEEQLWTCGMHPQVIQEEAGQCPICGMNLVPLNMGDDSAHDHDHQVQTSQWTCPEHPSIVEDEPGSCPIDGLDLVPVAAESPASGEREVLFYRNPMDPSISSPVPAKDSMGMDYVPVYSDEVEEALGGGATVRIEPAMVQNMNVRTERATRRDLRQPIRTVGYLDYDQERMVTVTTKYSGWVEKVYVNYIGEKVRRGQPLFEIYSPELVQTEQELLSAVDFARQMQQTPEDSRRRAESLVESARVRLGYWDISPEQIARIEESGEVLRTLTVVAPASGVVMKRMPGLQGMAVGAGMEIFHIADLSSLWLSVEVFEHHLAWVQEGTPAEVDLSYFPGETFSGSVRFLEPAFSEKTRTMRAKIEVPNPKGRLRQGMFATVLFEPIAVKQAIAVPQQAVLRTGQRSVVVVDLGGGRFAPRNVEVGFEAEGFSQILSGIEEGDMLVTSAQFLVDSESKLQEAIQKMIAQRGERSSDERSGGKS